MKLTIKNVINRITIIVNFRNHFNNALKGNFPVLQGLSMVDKLRV